jgi:hypothetical protein
VAEPISSPPDATEDDLLGLITAAWLAATLDAPVVSVQACRVGAGMVGMNVRYVIGYDGERPPGAPASLVAKMPSPDATSRATGIALRNYEREVRFYDELLPTLDVRAPRCYHASFDAGSGDFLLLLEDLAPAVPGNQITGCSTAEAELAVRELAALHAPRWNDPTLDTIEWLSRRGADDGERLQTMYQQCWPAFVDRYAPRLTAPQLELGAQFGPAVERWLDARTGPSTVTHGDYRLDNMMFGTAEGGDPIAIVDWQTPGQGPGAADLAYFLGAATAPELRRTHERALVAAYHDALTSRGVVGWSVAQCWESYRLHAFAGVIMAVIASMVVGRTDRGDDMFTAMATRHLQHAIDLDSWSLVG